MMKNKFFTILAVCAALMMFFSISSAQVQKCTEDGSIARVTKSSSGKFELVTFEVLSDSPDYKVSNAHRPFSDYGSEKPLSIKGNYFKSIVFRGVNWTCEIDEKLSTKTSTIMAVKNIEQFEGQVNYIIGYRTKAKYVSTTSTGTGKARKITLKFKK